MNILVTRSSPYGEELVKKLLLHGKNAWHLPLIKFQTGKNLYLLQNKINSLRQGDLIFIVSKNAIDYAYNWLNKSEYIWPDKINYYAIGKSTGKLINQLTGHKVFFPINEENSNNLLQLPSLNHIKGKKALILNGNNGLKILGNTLIERGAKVEYCECYHRYPIKYNKKKELNNILKLKIDTIIVTSAEILRQLYKLIPKFYRINWLIHCKLIVTSQRIYLIANQLGWTNITISRTANNENLIKIIKKIK